MHFMNNYCVSFEAVDGAYVEST